MKSFIKYTVLTIGLLYSTLVFGQDVIITSLTQTTGPTYGGSYVGIIGSNFNKNTVFTFGGERVILKRFIDSTTVYIMTVAHLTGRVDVTATNDSSFSTLENGFEFTNNAPVLDRLYVSNGLSENNGPAEGSTIIHYYGTDFTPDMTIKFSSSSTDPPEDVAHVESIRRRFYHSNRMYSYSPTWDMVANPNGEVDIKMENQQGESILTSCFTYKDDAPYITRIWPSSGIIQGGTLLRVWGRNFRASDNWKLGDTPVQFYYPNNSHIINRGRSGFVYLLTEEAVDLTTDVVDVSVTPSKAGIEAYTKEDAYEYTAAPPEITTVYPNKGFVSGSTAYIRGKNLSREMLVNFMLEESGDSTTDTLATITRYYHDGIIRVHTPARSPSGPDEILVDIKLANNNGTAQNLGGYTYENLSPRIHYAYPNNGVVEGNQYVYIRGRNFQPDETSVEFDSNADPLLHRIYRSNLLAVKTLESLSGATKTDITITNSVGWTTLGNGYFYTVKPPMVTTIYPTSGTYNGNQTLYIYGENLTPDTEVKIDNEIVSIDYFYHTQAIRVKTPSHAIGKADITVSGREESFTVENAYRFYENAPNYPDGAPVVNRVYPMTGIVTGGTYVYLYGINLNKDTVLTFDGKPANVRRYHQSGKRIKILTPPGDLGLVDIATSNVNGEVTFEDAFSYVGDGPVIKMIKPTKGFVYGGDYLYVYGTNFTKNMTVTLGNVKAILHHFYHSGAARFITAPNDNGEDTVNLSIVTEFGNDALSNAFEYALILPEIRSVTPNHGTSLGGTWIRIYGANFAPNVRVYFDSKRAPTEDVIYYNPGYIRVKTPDYSTDHHETVDIKLRTSGISGTTTEKNAFTYVHPSVTLSEAN